MNRRLVVSIAIGLASFTSTNAKAWDEKGHVIVTQMAAALLPDDFPAFAKSPEAVAHLSYLCVEPDRWRNMTDLPMGQLNQPDHYFDIDLLSLYELTPASLPALRYDYLGAISAYKTAHPEKDFGYDRSEDREHAHEWPGFAPYRITELYVLLRSSWRTLNTYEKHRDRVSAATIQSCQAEVLQHMGLMSHYVGDMAQPLHSTKHHHGWVGDNPAGYTTAENFHSFIDGGFIDQAGITLYSCLRRDPKRFEGLNRDQVFQQAVQYIERSFSYVEPLYQMEHAGVFQPRSERQAEGVAFIESRLGDAAGFLSALWLEAQRDAGIDPYRDKRLRDSSADIVPQPIVR